MPRAYSSDLRERVLAAAHDGQPHGAVAARFRVGESTVRGWLRRERLTGSAGPKPHGGGARPKVDAAGAPVLATLAEERTLAELAALYAERTGVALSTHAVWRACRRLDLRRKKPIAARFTPGPRAARARRRDHGGRRGRHRGGGCAAGGAR